MELGKIVIDQCLRVFELGFADPLESFPLLEVESDLRAKGVGAAEAGG